MRVIVTGGRDYYEEAFVWKILSDIHKEAPITLLAHGACHLGGADILAENWAKSKEVIYMGVPARFKTGKLGKAEGAIRNGRMLDLVKPRLVVAFPGGIGTADCVDQAISLDIEVRDFRNGV